MFQPPIQQQGQVVYRWGPVQFKSRDADLVMEQHNGYELMVYQIRFCCYTYETAPNQEFEGKSQPCYHTCNCVGQLLVSTFSYVILETLFFDPYFETFDI